VVHDEWRNLMPNFLTPLSFRAFKHGVLGAAAALSLAVTALAATPSQLDSAFAQFAQARQGDEAAIGKSAQAFAALLQAEPLNPVLMAYTGAATSMQATTTWLPWKKMSYAEDGLALLDKALILVAGVASAPGQGGVPVALQVRLVAANTFLAVPGFMNRAARGAKLLDEMLASPLLADAPLAFRAEVWLTAARWAVKNKRPDDARKYFGEVIKANAPQLEAARAQLKAMQP
jgi:hypothetical protein